MSLNDEYTRHRKVAQDEYAGCTPFRLGLAVGLAGETLPAPSYYKPASRRLYDMGFEWGQQLRDIGCIGSIG